MQDAYRFVLHSQNGIKDWPLQVYAGALIFSPERSITRLQYQSEAPSWIVNQPKVEYHWSSCLQTLEHGQNVRSVCFSCDSKLVASSSSRDIRLWDSGSGNCLSTFRAKSLAKSAWIDSISFSCNSRLMAVISDESGMKVWDITDGKCVARLGDLDEEVDYAMFLQHTDFIACKSSDERVSLWTDNNGEYLRHLAGHSRPAIRDFALSRCLGYFASGSHDGTIKVWDIKSGNCIHTIKSYKEMICSITFSPDSVMFASCSLSPGGEIKLWKPSDWGCSMILQHGHKYWVNSLTFSHDSKILASGSHDNTIKLWDTDSGDCFQTLHGHQSSINSLVFSHESQLLGSASNDGTVKIWDAQSREQPRQFDSHGCSSHLHFSHDLSLLASVAIVDIRYPGEVKIWDVRSGNCIQSLEGSKDRTCNLIFSNDLKLFAEGLNNDIIRIWDIRSATCLQEFTGSRDPKKFFLANPGLRLFDGTLASCSFSSYGPNSDTHGPYRRPVAYSISRDKRCITYKSECLLWLPPEYRLSPLGHSVQTESTMCIGCSSGRVVMFTFDSVVLSEILPVVKPGKMGGHVDGASAEI